MDELERDPAPLQFLASNFEKQNKLEQIRWSDKNIYVFDFL